MEAKKNPSKDVHRMRGMFFQIGLGISLALMITAFEWRTEVKKVRLPVSDGPVELMQLIPVTDMVEPELVAPSPIKNEMPPVKFASLEQFTEVDDRTILDEDKEKWTIDQTTIPPGTYIFQEDTLETTEMPFIHVENPAEPIGGYKAFYKMLGKEMKYPVRARHFEVQGRVIVEFIINRDGTPVELKVVHGIGAGCDEEAIRVIGLSKWNPGKQRGRPVRVKMMMPITFKLN
jgi:protein TonB